MFKNILVALFGVLFALVNVEILLSLFWQPAFLQSEYKRDDFSWLSKNVALNNFGYRDNDVKLFKTKDTFRIYSLGDSFTFGWYIDNQDLSYPNLLESKLTQKFGKNIEVINASQPGFKIQDSLERFLIEGILFSPDIVTLGVNLFDFTSHEFSPLKSRFKFINDLRLYEVTFGNLERARIARLTEGELEKSFNEGSSQFERNVKLLSELNELVISSGGILLLIIFPEYNSFNPNEPYLYSNFHESVHKMATAASTTESTITVVDLLEKFEKVEDKRKLVLNPMDNHPTVLANTLAADKILEKFDFDSFVSSHERQQFLIKTKKITVGGSLGNAKGIISLNNREKCWVYFDRKLDLGVQKSVAENTGQRQLAFVRDYLKTARFLTHQGWPGAKLEMNFPGESEIVIAREVYGYPIVGVSQITAFARKDGATNSRDLDLTDVEITKDSRDIKIKVFSGEKFDFYRINFDVSVGQIDIDEGLVLSSFETKIKTSMARKGQHEVVIEERAQSQTPGLDYSLPKFTRGSDSYGYIWYEDSLRKAKINKNEKGFVVDLIEPASEDKKIEFPIAVETSEKVILTVTYL